MQKHEDMEKKLYISPEVMVITLRPIQMIADSFTKGEGDFDPGNMTFAREDENNETDGNNNYSVWDNAW